MGATLLVSDQTGGKVVGQTRGDSWSAEAALLFRHGGEVAGQTWAKLLVRQTVTLFSRIFIGDGTPIYCRIHGLG
jgi:hypothetical protein